MANPWHWLSARENIVAWRRWRFFFFSFFLWLKSDFWNNRKENSGPPNIRLRSAKTTPHWTHPADWITGLKYLDWINFLLFLIFYTIDKWNLLRMALHTLKSFVILLYYTFYPCYGLLALNSLANQSLWFFCILLYFFPPLLHYIFLLKRWLLYFFFPRLDYIFLLKRWFIVNILNHIFLKIPF